jgi:DNA polymerase elongation subunit (family B)
MVETSGYNVHVCVVDDERQLLASVAHHVITYVHLYFLRCLTYSYDPDLLLGYDVQRSSWGYLIDRARLVYNMNLCAMLSRTPAHPAQSTCSTADSRYSSMCDIHPAGRIVLNLWRVMRHELTLQSYTLENLAYHCLLRRMPAYAWSTLALRYDSGHLPHVCVLHTHAHLLIVQSFLCTSYSPTCAYRT